MRVSGTYEECDECKYSDEMGVCKIGTCAIVPQGISLFLILRTIVVFGSVAWIPALLLYYLFSAAGSLIK